VVGAEEDGSGSRPWLPRSRCLGRRFCMCLFATFWRARACPSLERLTMVFRVGPAERMTGVCIDARMQASIVGRCGTKRVDARDWNTCFSKPSPRGFSGVSRSSSGTWDFSIFTRNNKVINHTTVGSCDYAIREYYLPGAIKRMAFNSDSARFRNESIRTARERYTTSREPSSQASGCCFASLLRYFAGMMCSC
jgi:hypothetical protein